MNSITRRLTFWLALTTVCLVSLSATLLFAYIRSAMLHQMDTSLFAKGHTLGSLVRVMRNGQIELDTDNVPIPEFSPGPHSEFFELRRTDGTLLLASASLTKLPPILPIGTTVISNRVWDLPLPDHRAGRAAAISVTPTADIDNGSPPPEVFAAQNVPLILIVAQDRSGIDGVLRTLFLGLSIAGATSIAIGILVMRLIIARSLATLYGLSQQAETIDPGVTQFSFPTTGLPAELLPICHKFNDLLQRLQTAFARERRINADIAHELRTPISELRSLTDVACRWQPTLEKTSEYFRDAQQIAIRMERLTESLLMLSRAQSNTLRPHTEAVAAAELVESITERLRNSGRLADRQIRSTIPARCVVVADKLMLERILQNLLDNAVDYASSNGPIEIAAELSSQTWHLHIINPNDKLSSDDVQHLFEAFWRKDQARSSDQHSGLGLAIVAEYARHLGIVVTPRLLPGDRFEMELQIPASDSEIESPSIQINSLQPAAH